MTTEIFATSLMKNEYSLMTKFYRSSQKASTSNMTPEEIITEIIRIMRIDGELATDGECLEMVGDLLEQNGYGPIYPTVNRTGDLGEFGKAFE
jgi:hypothetical protein